MDVAALGLEEAKFSRQQESGSGLWAGGPRLTRTIAWTGTCTCTCSLNHHSRQLICPFSRGTHHPSLLDTRATLHCTILHCTATTQASEALLCRSDTEPTHPSATY